MAKGQELGDKTGITLPTRKSAMSQLKDSSSSAGAGALTGVGEVMGEAYLGEVVGPLVGGIASSMFLKDETHKKIAVMLGARKSARNLLI